LGQIRLDPSNGASMLQPQAVWNFATLAACNSCKLAAAFRHPGPI
jgi:hypothetical protein